MGCGSSKVPRVQALADKQYFESVAKLKRSSVSIEEARKRREECAMHRVRRTSVMGQLEAEKLTQRKRSNASMYNNSATDVSTDINVPLFLHNMTQECKGRQQGSNIAESNTVASEKDEVIQPKILKTKVRITFSSESKPDLSTLPSDSSNEEARSFDQAPVVLSPSTTEAITVKEQDQELLKSQAKTIVERVISNAKKKVNLRATKRD